MKKFLLLAALLSSTSVMASDNSLPDLEEVKKGFTASNLTVDVDSEAGKLYRDAIRSGNQKDDEAKLLEAVKLGHAHAPRILFRQYGDENPFYRQLLLISLLKKMETGFTAGVDEETFIFGHHYLQEQKYSLEALMKKADSAIDAKQFARSFHYFYIADLTWKELGSHVVDLDRADEIVNRSKQSLKQLAAQGDINAIELLGKLVAKENNQGS
ncbi:MAG: hypothetical protein BGO77_08500 [Caedibacter sp. 37-49]|nr:MAG: hypothetical protein BGO77_08500 [Caedibacter sp. 37-49]